MLRSSMYKNVHFLGPDVRGCIRKFPDWPPGARTVNDTALCH
jgi:hypothetical protein